MTKEERIEAIEAKMDVMDDALCRLEELAGDFEELNEKKLLKQVKALEEAVQERYDQLDEKHDELEE